MPHLRKNSRHSCHDTIECPPILTNAQYLVKVTGFYDHDRPLNIRNGICVYPFKTRYNLKLFKHYIISTCQAWRPRGRRYQTHAGKPWRQKQFVLRKRFEGWWLKSFWIMWRCWLRIYKQNLSLSDVVARTERGVESRQTIPAELS